MPISSILAAATMAALVGAVGQNSMTDPKLAQDAALRPVPRVMFQGKALAQDAAFRPVPRMALDSKDLARDSAILQGIASPDLLRAQLAGPAPVDDVNGALENERLVGPAVDEAMRQQMETGDYSDLRVQP